MGANPQQLPPSLLPISYLFPKVAAGFKPSHENVDCPHGKNKCFCVLCDGNGLCEHKTSKYTCAKCNKGKEKKYNATYTIVHMEKGNMSAGRDVEVDVIVSMGNKNSIARIVVVVGCAKPHTVLPIKIRNMMDTVGIALPICFRISLLYGIIGRRRPLLQLFLKKSFLMLPGSATRL